MVQLPRLFSKSVQQLSQDQTLWPMLENGRGLWRGPECVLVVQDA